MTAPDYTVVWWRADGCDIYAQPYGEPASSDPRLGTMTSPELAAIAVTQHNAVTPPPGGF
jgi:hypothetical protein